MTLYEIGQDTLALHDALTELGGDISEPEVEAVFDLWFAEIKTNQTVKIDSYCALIREFEARAEARQNEIKRLQALAQADTSAADRLKKRLKWFMDTTQQTKIETPRFKVAVQKNGGVAPLVIPDEWRVEPAKAPEQFHKKVITLDTDLLRQELLAGIDIKDCAIGERGTHLRIR